MEEQQQEKTHVVDKSFPLFSKPSNTLKRPKLQKARNPKENPGIPKLEKETCSNPNNPDSATTETASFSDLGLAEWAIQTCKELGMANPTAVQSHCIPKILSGRDVLGLAQTGSGKTAAFALPILHRLAEDPYGVFSLVITPTRELAYQLAEQFRALGSCLHLRCAVVVGGMDLLSQAKTLMGRPHVVIATPGRIKVLLENIDISHVFSKTKFLVLDEADRMLDVGFQEELRVVFKCLPKTRQTLLFSATMTSELQTLLELSANKAYFYEAYEGFKTVDTLKQQYVQMPENVKEIYLVYILSKMEEMGIRSAMIFASTCSTCHLLSSLLKELDMEPAKLHSLESQSSRLASLHQFKSGRASILIATDLASRGLDIPTVDLVINYDLPRDPRDYVHRVGRTARAGREGLAVSLVTQHDKELVKAIEAEVGKQFEEFDCKENEILSDITKRAYYGDALQLDFTIKLPLLQYINMLMLVYKARRVAKMKMMDDGFDELVNERKKQKQKSLAEKGLLKNKKRKRKSLNR
ncbi:unnamed protein product [Dovyalis caffra]|uniref:RNA helicase n=1 Tax=Dovyalis caffra TaxID=77055 RepID=A0AAV1R114_9ROSI|nr:unnamed protein product [Dovyalis caffra]